MQPTQNIAKLLDLTRSRVQHYFFNDKYVRLQNIKES